MAVYGVDIGTSSCKLCMYDGKKCTVLEVADGHNNYWGNSKLLVSAAYLDGDNDDDLLVGQEAYNKHMLHPQWYLQEFKRKFSRTEPVLFTDTMQATVDDIYVQVLRRMNQVIQEQEEPADLLVMTHPAAYDRNSDLVHRLTESAKRAGFFEVSTIDEPSAAAEYYAYKHGNISKNENVLVYDFGGGTFDVALIRLEQDGFRHLTNSLGLENCGGADIDRQIREDMLNKLLAQPGLDGQKASQNRQFLSLLDESAVNVKHKLTAQQSAGEVIMVGFDTFHYTLTRQELNQMILPQIERTIDLCRQIVSNASLLTKNIHRVLLVGGTSYIPLVEELLRKAFPAANIGKSGSPEHMVCCGAAVSGNFSEADQIRRMAERGHLESMYKLGIHYLTGDCEEIEADTRIAFKWFMKAAELGEALSQDMVGDFYQFGIGTVQQDEETALIWHQKAAEQGVASAQASVGDYYRKKDDTEKAFEWYRRAAAQNDCDAQFGFGQLYLDQNDEKQAFQWFTKAAAQGHANAQYLLGVMYEQGRGVAEDQEQAFTWYMKAAEQDDPDAQCEIARRYFVGFASTPEDNDKAFHWGLKSAEQGNRDAQYIVAQCYEKGFGTAVDLRQAFEWYMKAAEQDLGEAQSVVANWYYVGRDPVEEDNDKAFYWGLKAAQQGIADAQYQVGESYQYGYGTEKNLDQAYVWCERAARQGNIWGQRKVATFFFEGLDPVEQNYRKAYEWAIKAAEAGDHVSQCLVASCYDNGQGVAENKSKAFEWYMKAAEQEFAAAERCVGICYYNGEGIPKNLEKAEQWLRKAAAHGDDAAIDIIKEGFAPASKLAEPMIIFKRNHRYLGSGRSHAVKIDNERKPDIKDGTSYTITVKPGHRHIEIANGPAFGFGTVSWDDSNYILNDFYDFDPGDILVIDITCGKENMYWQQIAGKTQNT